MDAAYFIAAVPEPVRCLGRKLKPFSVGHQILLCRFNSAFVTGAPVTLAELIFAISICSRTYEEALRFLDSRAGAWSLRLWGLKVFLAVAAGLDLRKSAGVFATYVQAGSTFPCVKFKESQQVNEIRVPLVAMVKTFLARAGYSDSEALNKPYGLALWEYTIAGASEGKAEIVDSAWREEVDKFSVTPQAELDRWREAAVKAMLAQGN